MFEWDKLIDDFSRFYYTPFLMLIVEGTALVIAIIYIRKTKIGNAFIFYIAFDFSLLILDFFLVSYLGKSKKSYFQNFQNTTNTLVAFIELLVYFYFFSKILKGTRIKKILIILSILYSLLILMFITTKFRFITTRYDYPFTANFFFLIKAFLCKKPLTI